MRKLLRLFTITAVISSILYAFPTAHLASVGHSSSDVRMVAHDIGPGPTAIAPIKI